MLRTRIINPGYTKEAFLQISPEPGSIVFRNKLSKSIEDSILYAFYGRIYFGGRPYPKL